MIRTHILNISAISATLSSIKLSHMEETTSTEPVPMTAGADMLRAAACRVCEHYCKLQKGGRLKKLVHTGRPPSISPRYYAQHVKEIASPPLVEPATTISICHSHQAIDTSHLHCPICCNILLSPIELVTCGSLVCAQCCCIWLTHCTQLTCPCCYHPHITDFSTIRPASPLILSTLGSLCVVCEKCDHHTSLTS